MKQELEKKESEAKPQQKALLTEKMCAQESQTEESGANLEKEEIQPKGNKIENQKRKKLPLTHRMSAKVSAFILLIVMSIVTAASILGAAIMIDGNIYTTPKDEALQYAYKRIGREDARELAQYVLRDQENMAAHYLNNRNIAYAAIIDKAAQKTLWQSGSKELGEEMIACQYYYNRDDENFLNPVWADDSNGADLQVTIMTPKAHFKVADGYQLACRGIGIAYALRYWIYVIGGLAGIFALSLFIFLLCAVGHRGGLKEVQPSIETRIPFDLFSVLAAIFSFIVLRVVYELLHYLGNTVLEIILLGIGGIIIEAIVIGWCMSFALRIKLGKWWRNTLVYRVPSAVFRKLRGLFFGEDSLISNMPLIWKTAVIAGGICLIEFCFIVVLGCNLGVYLFFWFIGKLILIPVILYIALMLRKLQKGGEALAAGDLSYQINTEKMFWDFKTHGENLNSIANGMTLAVEERLKSERMKTELITNVSHDIKTPLTSIINYADLIGKETCENEKITEYADVLVRQSERLKRLIEDLVEASKASTGNLDVLMAPCEADIFLSQAAGEFEQRLENAGLELIVKQPEEPIKIMADSRRMWRIFDNLMNNICKYAQSGTRVYLSLEKAQNEAVITFKNTSKVELDISAEELMERFVRGDESRNTEGNGLGLSIAKSLTQLQNGKLELTVDGDLFKATLRFPIIE